MREGLRAALGMGEKGVDERWKRVEKVVEERREGERGMRGGWGRG